MGRRSGEKKKNRILLVDRKEDVEKEHSSLLFSQDGRVQHPLLCGVFLFSSFLSTSSSSPLLLPLLPLPLPLPPFFFSFSSCILLFIFSLSPSLFYYVSSPRILKDRNWRSAFSSKS